MREKFGERLHEMNRADQDTVRGLSARDGKVRTIIHGQGREILCRSIQKGKRNNHRRQGNMSFSFCKVEEC
jgi:hypothetical protein